MIHRGMSLREAIQEASRLGVRSELVHGTGEVRFFRPDGRPVVVNGRKKDAACVVVSMLRQVEKAQRAGGV